MKIIEVRPSREFGGTWVAFEAPGVEPAHRTREVRIAGGDISNPTLRVLAHA